MFSLQPHGRNSGAIAALLMVEKRCAKYYSPLFKSLKQSKAHHLLQYNSRFAKYVNTSQRFYKVKQNQFRFNLLILKFLKLIENRCLFLLHAEFNFFFQSEMGKGKTQIGWKDKGGSVQENHHKCGFSHHVPKIDGQIEYISSLYHWHDLSFLKNISIRLGRRSR